MKKKTSLAIATALSASIIVGAVPSMSAEENEELLQTTEGTIADEQAAKPAIEEPPEENTEEYVDASTIKHIIIEGINEDKQKAILRLITHTRVDDNYSKENIKRDLEAITKSGVVQSVRARTIISNGELYVVFEAKEIVDVTEVVITGNSLVPSSEITPLLLTQPKREFIKDHVDQDVQTIKDTYAKKGYIAIVSGVNNTNGRVSFNVIEAKVEDVVYTGNKRTKNWLIDKVIGYSVKKGDYLTTAALQSLYKNLMSTGLFKDVTVDAGSGSQPDLVVLNIALQEEKTGQWNLGGGYSSQYKAQVVGGVSDRNVNGEGKIINFDFGIGKEKQSYSFNYIDPYFAKGDGTFSFNLHRGTKSVDNRIAEYDETRTGGYIGFSKPISKDKRTRFFTSFNVDNIQADTTKGEKITSLQSNTLTLGVINDTRDDAVDPTQGSVLKGGITTSQKFFGSDESFTKFFAEAKYYTKIAARDVLAARLQVNYSPNNIPYLEQFTVGGIDSVRGLDEDEQRGNKSLIASLEFRHKFNDNLQGVIFADAGKAWNDVVDNAMKVAYGVGVRVKTGLGMLRFDIAKAPGESAKYLFGIGQSF